MPDGFFDMPAGYSDADLEMAALEDAGRRWRQRYGRRGLTFEDVQRMRDGAMITVHCKRKDTGETYDALMVPTDTDELGPCDFRYSCDDGASWHETARAAYDCATARDSRPERCAVCGGLNPGDATHTRC